MHKILWDFEIQMDSLIPPRRPDPELIKKENQSKNQDHTDHSIDDIG